MSIEICEILELLQRVSKTQSGVIEFFVPSLEQQAVDIAVDAGYLDMIGNGVAQISKSGRNYIGLFDQDIEKIIFNKDKA